MEIKGIDVSHWQNDINWPAVRADGVEFAILKAGGSDKGFYKDSKFEENYRNAKMVGMAVGAYYFVGKKCLSYEDGAADAERFKKIIAGKTFEYPVYIDIETTRSQDKAGATAAVRGFVETMEKSGYFCGVYASEISGFKDRLDDSQLQDISHWVARYGDRPTRISENIFHIWQYSSKGRVNGIDGNVDMDVSYVDLESVIKKAYLNGFKNEKLSNYEVAANVIRGNWTMEDVSEEGYDMTQVQHIVDVYKKVRELL